MTFTNLPEIYVASNTVAHKSVTVEVEHTDGDRKTLSLILYIFVLYNVMYRGKYCILYKYEM